MRVIEDVKLDYADVLILPKRSTLTSRKDVNLQRTFKFKYGGQWTGIPIIAANMDGVGTFEMAKALREFQCLTALTKHYEIEQYLQFYKELGALDKENHIERGPASAKNLVIYSLGMTTADLTKFRKVATNPVARDVRMVCIDVANGYTQRFVDFVRQFRDEFPQFTLIAGNVVTPEMTEELILSGVDIVKVGIGPGSVCTTRRVAGVGYPQLSAVIECADAAHGLGGHIIADGGCQVPGDVSKAFGGGADFIMLGGMLAGHTESGLVTVGRVDGKVDKVVPFHGMSSDAAQKEHGGTKEYRASEGREVVLQHRGPVAATMKEILGGLRSACTYVGAKNLKELPKRTAFVRVSRQLNQIFEST